MVFFIACGSCQFKPDREDYELTSCFLLDMCLYRNKDNPGKSVCQGLVSECCSSIKYDKCSATDRPDELTFKDCWLFLNLK